MRASRKGGQDNSDESVPAIFKSQGETQVAVSLRRVIHSDELVLALFNSQGETSSSCGFKERQIF